MNCTSFSDHFPENTVLDYDQIAQRFQMIESNMQSVIVPYCDGNKDSPSKVEQLLKKLETETYTGDIARQLQGYLVQVPEQGIEALMAYGAVRPIQPEKFGNQFLVLDKSFGLYQKDCGLSWEDTNFIRSDALSI